MAPSCGTCRKHAESALDGRGHLGSWLSVAKCQYCGGADERGNCGQWCKTWGRTRVNDIYFGRMMTRFISFGFH